MAEETLADGRWRDLGVRKAPYRHFGDAAFGTAARRTEAFTTDTNASAFGEPHDIRTGWVTRSRLIGTD